MTRKDVLKWFDKLDGNYYVPAGIGADGRTTYKSDYVRAWATEAESALADVFPEAHPVRANWAGILASVAPANISDVYMQLVGVFHAAHRQIAAGRIESLIDRIRVDSEIELLDHAIELADADARAAAMVIAGGALRHTCVITSQGMGSR